MADMDGLDGGRRFYEDWARHRGAGRDFAAVAWDDLGRRERDHWASLAGFVARRQVYTDAGRKAAEGVDLQKKRTLPPPPHHHPYPFGGKVEADEPFDSRLLFGIGASPGRAAPNDVVSESDALLRRSLEALASDAKLRKAFLDAFFDHVVDDHLLFSR